MGSPADESGLSEEQYWAQIRRWGLVRTTTRTTGQIFCTLPTGGPQPVPDPALMSAAQRKETIERLQLTLGPDFPLYFNSH